MFQNPTPAVVLAAALAVSGCSVYSIVGAVPPSPEEAAEINRIAATPESTQAFLAGTTVKGYEKLHGTQIEYLGRNGLASLWYPGNTETVPSRWKVEQAGAKGRRFPGISRRRCASAGRSARIPPSPASSSTPSPNRR